jgi:hypothetical protein
MRFHSTAHDEQNQIIFECHVFADSPGAASDKLMHHFRDNTTMDEGRLVVWSIEVRDDIVTDLPII